MKPEKSPPMKMGKRGRLAMTLVWTAITLIWGVQVLQTMETGAPSKRPELVRVCPGDCGKRTVRSLLAGQLAAVRQNSSKRIKSGCLGGTRP